MFANCIRNIECGRTSVRIKIYLDFFKAKKCQGEIFYHISQCGIKATKNFISLFFVNWTEEGV